jgi:penicillin-binding protein 2
VDLGDALAVSCNGYFAHAAGEMGIEVFAWWARRLGFGEKTGLEITGESAGLVPDPAWKAARAARNTRLGRTVGIDATWHPGETWQVGFGQGALLVTPVQVARLMAIVSNGGYSVKPTLLLGEGRLGERVVAPETLVIVREGLAEVVRRGTASRTDLDRFHVAGKTGTGDLPGGMRNVAWFAGYAPANGARIAFACCFVDVEGYGGGVAGPVCSAFLEEYTKP